MIEITKGPFAVNEVIHFDFTKLSGFLSFLEKNICIASTEIVNIKKRIACLDDIKQDLKEIHLNIQSFNKRFDSIETTIFGHQQKFLELEAHFKSHDNKLSALKLESEENKSKISGIEENLRNLNPITEENVKAIEVLTKQNRTLQNQLTKNTSFLDSHDKIIGELASEVKKFANTEKILNSKIKKQKEEFNEKMTQITNKFNDIDHNFQTVFQNIDVDLNKVKINKITLSSQSEQVKEETHVVNLLENEEFLNFVQKTDKEFFKINDELIDLKNKINLEKNAKESESIFKELITSNSKEGDKAMDILKDIQKNEKFIISALFTKVGKDELDKVSKTFNQELDKLYQRFNNLTLYQDGPIRTDNISPKMKPKKETVEEQPINSAEEFKINLFKIIQEDSKLNNIFSLHETFVEENQKLYQSIIDIRNQIRTGVQEEVFSSNLESINNNFNDISTKINTMQLLIDSMNKSDTIEVENRELGSSTQTTMKDFVRGLSNGLKFITERTERLASRLDNFNAEVLNKIKKDLSYESNKVLDEFRIDLKGNIFRIQEQLREKVDKMNMDEFSRKLENRVINEISKKLDRQDLKKNTHEINRKIEHLENKISKTLVDTLIDLQLEDAPLLIKKNQKGGDKCGSCNQYLPNMTTGNLISQLNFLNEERNHNPMGSTISTAHNLNNLKKNTSNTTKGRNKESITNPGLKQSASAYNLNLLPEISQVNPATSVSVATNTATKFRKAKEPTLTPNRKSQPSVKYLDEYAERQLHNMINEELEKDILRPEMLLRAGNRVFGEVERKAANK